MRVPPSSSSAPASSSSRDRVLASAAQAFAQRFATAPTGDAQAIIAHVDAEAPELSTAVNEALFHHGPTVFSAAVRRALVKPAG